ncbi:endonuclease [Gordonia phage Yvonnetastic]|uniref:HNH endonuclease n=1 Tax=Gordonia phage Yvonnetastic TaxID=1821566 RepID=A0A142K932_9CAUD|nr:endonuclease [Gordonia phage Yvonnetastic]AMS02615.1 HNH endonuclease [Gordonia phage Yvonnetastic]WKW86047.1 HNH endonuclease [Gordonia Phage JonJames]
MLEGRSRTLESRYWSRVEVKGRDECWPWTGGVEPFGHGVIYLGRFSGTPRNEKAHRLAYEFHHGKPPGDLVVRHTCDNPPCQNPRHLILGTQADNIRDMYSRSRNVNDGRPGTSHPMHKISDADVRDMRDRYSSGGVRYKDLALEYDLSEAQVGRIIKRERWKHLP